MVSLTAYGPNPLAGVNRNNAASRGWGPGWPNAQEDKMVVVAAAGVRVRVRREIAELVKTLMLCSAARGYKFIVGQCWGFANRAIRGTSTPSNHSWGLATDWNSLLNPQSRPLQTNLPPAVVHDWEACHFYWGGRYTNATPDPMHFEYVGSPADVAADLKRAKALLASLSKAPTDVTAEPDDEDDDMKVQEYEDYNERLYGPKGTLGVWRVQDRAWQKSMLDATNAQTKALQDIAAALKSK